MKFQKWIVAAMGAATLGMATLTLTMSSNAQGGPPVQGVGQAGPRGQGFPGQPGGVPGAGGQFRPGAGGFIGGGGGGGTAMDSDNNYLYIVQGGQLFKIAKSDLKIMNSIPLMMAPGRDGFAVPEGPAPFGGPQRRGGGGAATPPPPLTINSK